MENLTLGQIGSAIAFVVALITGVGYISSRTKKFISMAMSDQMHGIDKRFDDIDSKMDGLSATLSVVDMESCKNYLVSFLSEVERRQPIDEIERERFWEQYEHYKKIGGNSYLQRRVEELREKKWL